MNYERVSFWLAVIATVMAMLAIGAMVVHADAPGPHPGHSAPLIQPSPSPTPVAAVLAIRVPDTGGASR